MSCGLTCSSCLRQVTSGTATTSVLLYRRKGTALPRIASPATRRHAAKAAASETSSDSPAARRSCRSEEHTSELQSRQYLVCRLLLEKKKKKYQKHCRRALTQKL